MQYTNWRHKVKQYITNRAWDPTNLTEDQLASVLQFARSLPPLTARLALLKTAYRKSEVSELERHIKILVKDVGKKLQTTIERRNADPENAGVREEGEMVKTDWTSPFCPRAMRIHIVRRTGAVAAEHAFLNLPWYPTDPDRGVAWGVLESPDMPHLLRAIKAQRVECEIGYPRYLIGATSQGSRSLRREPRVPLPLPELIFLYGDDDIRAWQLANQQDGKDPLDLLVLESRQDAGEDAGQTPEPLGGRYPFLDPDVWEHGAQEDLFGQEMSEDDGSDDGRDVDEDVESEDFLEPLGAGAIMLDDQNHRKQRDPCVSRTGTHSPHPSDTTSDESWNPPSLSAPGPFIGSGRHLNPSSQSAPRPLRPSRHALISQSAKARPQESLTSTYEIIRQVKTGPPTSAGPESSRREPQGDSGLRRPSGASNSRRSEPSKEEKERQARALLQDKPWLASFLGAPRSTTSGIDTTPVDHATFDSPATAGATEPDVVRVESTPAAPDTPAPSSPTPVVLDPVLHPPRSLRTLRTSMAPPPATPSAPNTTLVPTSRAAPTSKGTKGQWTKKKRRAGRRQ